MTRASLAKDPSEVQSMFDSLSPRYDMTNDVLSLWQDRAWRRETVRSVAAANGERILDVAAGTGTSSIPLAAAGAVVISSDFSIGMLVQGRRQAPGLRLVAGDATALPFEDDAFDAVTISFGLRNVVDVEAALVEMLRVTRPGGRLVVCEFTHPTWAPFRKIYVEYLMRALPAVARRVASAPEAYEYLAESIRAWPTQPELARQIDGAGWSQVAWRNLSGGIVALHRAVA